MQNQTNYSVNVGAGFLTVNQEDTGRWSWHYSRPGIPCGGLVFSDSVHNPGWFPEFDLARRHAMQTIEQDKWVILGYRVLDDTANVLFSTDKFETMCEFLRSSQDEISSYCGFNDDERKQLQLLGKQNVH